MTHLITVYRIVQVIGAVVSMIKVVVVEFMMNYQQMDVMMYVAHL